MPPWQGSVFAGFFSRIFQDGASIGATLGWRCTRSEDQPVELIEAIGAVPRRRAGGCRRAYLHSGARAQAGRNHVQSRHRPRTHVYALIYVEIETAIPWARAGRRLCRASRNNVAAAYWQSPFARDGGLLSYGPDFVDNWRRSATYVDRILRGAKPAELPVQLPTKFEMVVNLKTAKTLGLTVPQSILLSAAGGR